MCFVSSEWFAHITVSIYFIVVSLSIKLTDLELETADYGWQLICVLLKLKDKDHRRRSRIKIAKRQMWQKILPICHTWFKQKRNLDLETLLFLKKWVYQINFNCSQEIMCMRTKIQSELLWSEKCRFIVYSLIAPTIILGK